MLSLVKEKRLVKKKKEGFLLLLFAFFAFFSFFALSEGSQKGENNFYYENKNDVFISYEDTNTEKIKSISIDNDKFIFVDSTSYFVMPQVLGVVTEKENRENIISYRVQEEDTVSSIAANFNISTDTIRWANDISGNKVKEGDELLILPVTGTIYYVERGDTTKEIAKIHKAEEEEIVAFNDIANKNLSIGDRIIIPGGTPPPPPPPPTKPSAPTRVASSNTNTSPSPSSSPSQTTPAASSTPFINPVPGGMITQGVHSYNAVDIHNDCGTTVIASAAGRVTDIGWGTWPAGNFIKIDHNNVVVLYAHMQNITVSVGESIAQGQRIGTVGNTGRTVGRTGCHLHFDVLSRRISNPFGHLGVGTRL